MAQHLLTEEREVIELLWRMERFEQLKFDHRTARMLAETRVDWHEAERLLLKGATHALVYRILR